jgi:hypothetical protein
MATAKQAAANKANSQKSTGATTAEGKATVSKNAIRHGLLSQRLIITGEEIQDFDALLVGLMQSVAPEGMLEKVLVEKVAVAMWRQKRLVAAESASIELGRRLESQANRNVINRTLNLGYGGMLGEEEDAKLDELKPLSKDEQETLGWCRDFLKEYAALDDEALYSENLARLKKEAPIMFEELEQQAEELPLEAYTNEQLREGADNLVAWSKKRLSNNIRREKIRDVAAQVLISASAPVNNGLLARYSAGLDNELYRAIEALRKQQEFRLKNGSVELEAEAA